MAVEVAIGVGFLEADSGCFPFNLDEMGKFGDVSDAFVCKTIRSPTVQKKRKEYKLTCNGEPGKALKPILFEEEFDVLALEGKESSIGSSEGIGG